MSTTDEQQRTYAGLADAQGYVRIGDHMVHVEMMRGVDVRYIAHFTGVPVDELRLRAIGVWAPLGLDW